MPDSSTVSDPKIFAAAPEDSAAPTGEVLPLAGRLTCSVAEACSVTGLGRTKVYELIADGSIATKTIGRRRLIIVQSLRSLFVGDPT